MNISSINEKKYFINAGNTRMLYLKCDMNLNYKNK